MLYENTESGKIERLGELKNVVTEFISRLDGITTKPTESEGIELLHEVNEIFCSLSRAWGPQEQIATDENKRLKRAYDAFWYRVDRGSIKNNIFENDRIRVTVPPIDIDEMWEHAEYAAQLQGRQTKEQALRGLVLSHAMSILGNRSELQKLESEEFTEEAIKKAALNLLFVGYLQEPGHCSYNLSELLTRVNGGHRLSPGMESTVDAARTYAVKYAGDNPVDAYKIGLEALQFSKSADVRYRTNRSRSNWEIEIKTPENMPDQIGLCRM